jgi:hypothetical protein
MSQTSPELLMLIMSKQRVYDGRIYSSESLSKKIAILNGNINRSKQPKERYLVNH